MQHIDEHTLELYHLGVKGVLKQRKAIEEHLRACSGCKEMSERISKFYDDAEGVMLEGMAVKKKETRSLVPRSPADTELYGNDDSLFQVPRATSLNRVGAFVRRYPKLTALGSFASFAAMLLILNAVGVLRDTNPAYALPNNGKRLLEVYNRNNALLWSLRWSSNATLDEPARPSQQSHYRIVDLNHDGRNELVTTIPFLGSDTVGENVLQVFDEDGQLQWARKFNDTLQFRGVSFGAHWSTRGFILNDFNANKKEILVDVSHRYSPQMLVRVDADGNRVGSYLHYGHLFEIRTLNAPPAGGKKNLLAAGINDCDSTAIVAILDPALIVGAAESTVTPGFGVPASPAEICYVRFPKNEIDKTMKQKPRASFLGYESVERIGFSVGYRDRRNDRDITSSLDYEFSPDFRVLTIKVPDPTRRTFDLLFGADKGRAPMDSLYLNKLMRRVNYWDGQKWCGSQTEIHRAVLSVMKR